MRNLVLLHNGKVVMTSITAGPIKARIQEWPDDDVDLYQVYSAPVDYSHLPAFDDTESFAKTWAHEVEFCDGIEPHDYLAKVPPFVRHFAGATLTTLWQRWMAETDQSFIPGPIRQVA